MSPKEKMGVGVVEAANSGSERKREGQKRRREGSRDGTRDAVSSLERGRGMRGKRAGVRRGVGGSVFDLRS